MKRSRTFTTITITILLIAITACYVPPPETELGQSTMSGPLELTGAGSASAPALFLNDDSDTGLYHVGADNLGITINGALDFDFAANDFTAASGSVVKTNTISETTSGNGVTVDGLTIKDTGFADDFTLTGTTPQMTIGDAGAEDTALVFDGNAQDYYVGLDDTADDLLVGLGSTVGTTGIIHLDANQDMGLGSASAGSKLDVTGNVMIDGAADEEQLVVQGNGTQTNNPFVVEQSDGTDKFTVSDAGNTTVEGTLAVTGASTFSSGLDMANNAITNIGAAGTDFSATGGLTLADALTVSSGSVDFPSGSIALADLASGLHGFGSNVHSICSSGCDYTGLESAVSAASSGDTIIVAPGTYTVTDSIALTKNLAIIGSGKSVTTIKGPTVALDSTQIIRSSAGNTLLLKDIAFTCTEEAEDALGLITGTFYLFDVDITGGADAGNGLYTEGGTTYVYNSTLTGGDDSTGNGGGSGLRALGGTHHVYNTILTGGAPGAGDAGRGMSFAGGTANVWNSTATGGTGGAGYFATAGTGNIYNSVISAAGTSKAVELWTLATLNLRRSRVVGTGTNQQAVDVGSNTATTNIYQSVLIGTGSAAGAVTCATGTTVSVALSATNITPITEATDCTNDIGTPNNVVDAQVD